MFKIEYRISKSDYDNFVGEKGYYTMHCNENVYGEIYSKELEEIMGTEYLYDWFEDMVKIAIELQNVNYIALSNIESYNLWIEFVRESNDLFISLVDADKPNGVGTIAYKLINKCEDKNFWKDESVDFSEFKQELVRAVTSYVKDVELCNENETIKKCSLLLQQLKNLR